jgi:hypothetical protein
MYRKKLVKKVGVGGHELLGHVSVEEAATSGRTAHARDLHVVGLDRELVVVGDLLQTRACATTTTTTNLQSDPIVHLMMATQRTAECEGRKKKSYLAYSNVLLGVDDDLLLILHRDHPRVAIGLYRRTTRC